VAVEAAEGYSEVMTRILAALLLLLGLAAPAAAQIDRAPKVQARLIAEAGEIAPAGTVAVALEEIIRPGWHTYWVNPGDAGAPTTLDWSLPAGWSAGAIQWPYPKRLPVGPLMDYGYEGKVWLLTAVTAPSGAKPDANVVLHAHATWLVCRDVCVPEETDLTLPLTVSASPSPPYATDAADFAAARSRLPVASPWPVTFHAGRSLDLFVASPALAGADPKGVSFFPLRADVLNAPAPQKLGTADNGIVLSLAPTKKASALKTLDGDLVVTSRDGSVEAFAVSAKAGTVPQVPFAQPGDLSLPLALAFAFLGGLILNLMPCVLPILAIKALAVASHAKSSRAVAMRESLAYGVGAALSFLALGGAVVALRAGGAAIGWGFQLQEPAVVAGSALLMFAVGLNLSGAFEISQGIAAGDSLARRGGSTGAFFTGVLAVAVAAPCTAPFMAAALGFALSQSTGLALAVFAALGLGFALPFTAIGFSPRLLSLIPKPGPWMIRFRELLAFPMYGAAAWLAWVLSEEAGSQGLLAVFAGALALGFAAYAWSASRGAKPRWRAAGALAALAALALAVASIVYAGGGGRAPAAGQIAEAGGMDAQPYSAAALNTLRGENRPVFIDATAAWCITCLVNEKVAFSDAAVRAEFAKKHIAYLMADWTNRDAAITALLQAHGRSGVPLYLYYAPGAVEAKVLPQILTPHEVLGAIGTEP